MFISEVTSGALQSPSVAERGLNADGVLEIHTIDLYLGPTIGGLLTGLCFTLRSEF